MFETFQNCRQHLVLSYFQKAKVLRKPDRGVMVFRERNGWAEIHLAVIELVFVACEFADLDRRIKKFTHLVKVSPIHPLWQI